MAECATTMVAAVATAVTATTAATTTATRLRALPSQTPLSLHDNGYVIKRARLELEQSWIRFQRVLQASPPSTAKEHLRAHMEAARYWKSWGDLKQMQKTVLLMGNIARQNKLGDTIDECLNDTRETIESVLASLEQMDWT